MRRHALVVTVGTCLTLAGCSDGGGANGVAELGPGEIRAEVQEAVDQAESVHATGSFEFGNGGILELDITADRSGGTGTVAFMGSEFEVLSVAGTEYMRASAEVWENMTTDAAEVDALADRWAKGSAGSRAGIDMSRFLDLELIVEGLLVPDDEFAKGEETEVNGQAVIGLETPDGVTIYIATTGEPLPVQRASPDGESGSLDLEWDVDAEIAVPDQAEVVDLSEVDVD